MRDNVEKPERPQMTTWRIRTARRTPKATNTHSEYVILIALPLQKQLQERASILRYTYIPCFVLFFNISLKKFPFLSKVY
jgi:hypothetical protein